jgi:DNA-binding NtrC family response regulator
VIKNKSGVKRLLVVSRDAAILRPLWSIVDSNDWRLEIAADPWDAIALAQSEDRLDLALLDLPRGTGESLNSLRWLCRLRPGLPVIILGPLDNGWKQESMENGARDYLLRPITNRQMESAIWRQFAIASKNPRSGEEGRAAERNSGDCFPGGVSPIMQKLRAEAALLAEVDVPVLILGEDGSGREITARLIHSLSARSGCEFARINCAALPPDLLEKELFGYERRGHAGPARTRAGKLELCAKGTIFLDEIAALQPHLQIGILQVLRNRRFSRSGSSAWVDVDVRVVAAGFAKDAGVASAVGLEAELYRQLHAHSIHVPLLRERKEELSYLSRHFMHRLAKHYGLSPKEFSPAFIEAWQGYRWQGNPQELERRVTRYLTVTDDERALRENRGDPQPPIESAAWFGKPWTGGSQSAALAVPSPAPSLRSHLQNIKAEAERSAIAAALQKTGWNRKAAARLLKVSYRTVLYKIDQYRIVAPQASATETVNRPEAKEAILSGN